MGRRQNETSWLKHQTLCEIQSNEVFLSGFIALCTFSHLLHEVKLKKTKQVKMKNDNLETTSIQDTTRRWKTKKWKHYTEDQKQMSNTYSKIGLLVYKGTLKG